ncbi:MAG: bacterial Ig-like domain-containing protein, partial [Clostridiales bacterium]|nr:bacterial Ig-like domain-containing protein [Clostridiales bacterium]
MKKRKIAIFILAIITLSAAVGGAVAAWVTGARLEGTQITTGSISLNISEEQGGNIPMSKSLNWVDVDYNDADYDTLDGWATAGDVAKANFSIKNTSERSLDITVTFDSSKYANAEGVDNSIVAWFYEDNTALADGISGSQLTTTYKYLSAFDTSETKNYTLFMLTPKSLQNGFAADKNYRFDIVASGTLSSGDLQPDLVALKVDASNAKTTYEIGDTFSHDGIVVTGYYSDGSSKQITEGYTVSTPDMKTPGIKTVTVSYEGMEAYYDITVQYVKFNGESLTLEAADADPYDGRLQGNFIGALYKDNTISYTIESTDDFNNVAVYMYLHAGIWNGSDLAGVLDDAFTIYVNDVEYGPSSWNGDNNKKDYLVANINLPKGEVTITIKMGANVDNNFNFYYMRLESAGEESTLERIEVDATRANTEYHLGEEFSSANIVVTAYYSDDEPQVVDSDDYTVSTPDMTTVGIKTVTVSYQGKTATYEITVIFADEYNGTELLLEAEQANRQGNCGTENNGAAHGGKFVNAIANGDKLTFLFKSNVEQVVELHLAISHGNSGITRAFDVYVNGNESAYQFDAANSGGWFKFTAFSVCKVKLKAGLNIIVLESINTGGQVNVDYLKITPVISYDGVATTYGATSATYENCQLEEGGNLGYIETNCVITYNIYSTLAQWVELKVSVASGQGGVVQEAFELFVNGNSLGRINVTSNGWDQYYEIEVGYVQLNEGYNTIEIKAVNANFNFKYLGIAPLTNYEVFAVVTGADLVEENGKVYFTISGTVNGNVQDIESLLKAIPFDLQENCCVITNNPEYWDRSERLYLTAARVELGENTWTIYYDVTDMEIYAYHAHFGANSVNPSGDLKIDSGAAQDGKSFNVNGRKYTLINRWGQEGVLNYWGCVGLRITPILTVTDVDLTNEGDNVYLVIKGASEHFTKEQLQAALMVVEFDLQHNGSAGATQENQWKNIYDFIRTPIVYDGGNWELKIDITNLEVSAYTAHFNGGNLESANTTIDGKSVASGSKGYVIVNKYGEEDVNNDGTRFWGAIGIYVDDAIKVTAARLEAQDNTVYLALEIRIIGYAVNKLTLVDKDKSYTIAKQESQNGLYTLYFDISDMESESDFWCHLYVDGEPYVGFEAGNIYD